MLGMAYVTFFNPGLQDTLLQAAGKTFTEGALAAVGGAYGSGQVIQAMIITFIVNLFPGSLIEMTLPSLIIPFSGLLMGIYRAILWGLLLSPSNASLAGPMIPHSLTLLLEGQAYILVMLSIYIHGKAFLRPGAYGIQGRLPRLSGGTAAHWLDLSAGGAPAGSRRRLRSLRGNLSGASFLVFLALFKPLSCLGRSESS